MVPPVQVGAATHAALMAIHPFTDGKGRTGRLLLNLWLMRHHHPPALLDPRLRGRYYAVLEAADGGYPQPITRVVAHGIARTMALCERVLGLTPLTHTRQPALTDQLGSGWLVACAHDRPIPESGASKVPAASARAGLGTPHPRSLPHAVLSAWSPA